MHSSKWDQMFQYSCKTGTSGLHSHIYCYHILEYVTLTEQNGWYIWLDSIKSAVAHGYTLAEIRDVLTDGGSIALPAPRGHDTSASDSTHPNERASIPSFTLQELHNHIITFIVTDDQVLPFKSNITH
jgi:predicted RNase H-like HicB family nuclease